MTPSISAIKQAQSILKERVEPSLLIDGDFGNESTIAAKKFIIWNFRGAPTPHRWVAAIIQREAILNSLIGVVFDAFYGPDTEDFRRRLLAIKTGIPLGPRPDEKPTLISTPCRNPSTSEFNRKYGSVGTGQVIVNVPYSLKLDWDLGTNITRFSCHKLVADSIVLGMEKVHNHYGINSIRDLGLDRFGGCLNVRLKRGGTSYSTHAWGVAIDWFPSVNTLKETKRTARFARDEYKAFLDIWSDLGWMSLGRCYDFDWMHIQKNP